MPKKTVEQKYPTKKARDAADKAIDKIDVNEPMCVFLDEWITAYRANGGIER